MGTVYLCEHLTVGRKVAVKVLPTSQADNPASLGRFYREARASGVLDHPNLVKAHDVDQEGPLHYLVMEYVDGSSLQDIVARFGPLSTPRACHYVKMAAQGLQAAHAAGLIHRDVKPGNVILERNGNVRVLDLGLARFYNDNVDPLTLKYDDKHVLGTADYVAPEQALNSHEVDIRADVYSLGATFYFLLTGRPPFPEGKTAQKLIWHQVREPTPIREVRRDVPEAVAAIIERMMVKDPARRYQSPAEVVEALLPLTTEPVPPPAEKEMPRLSLAATSGNPAVSLPATPRRGGGPASRSRTAHTAAMPTPAVESSAVVATLGKAPSAAEVGTPRALAANTPVEASRPRTPGPIVPSRRLKTSPASRRRGRGSLFWLLLLVSLSALVGIGLNWWLTVR
jgi:serine/threonine protein kinase